MTARELRQKYLDFFRSKGHTVFPSGSLVPYDVTGRLDESLLFNGAGMVQFKPYFRGIATPPNPRLTTAQKVVRTGDIEEVGDDTHLTFFEMMGNFSIGDYFKKEAIAFSWEFITELEWLNLDPKRLAVTIFLDDDESYGHWAGHFESVGIDPATRIFRRDEDENYWPQNAFSKGPPGPCGPNSEMYYWVDEDRPAPPCTQAEGGYPSHEFETDAAKDSWLEFWNDVFIQYEWQGHHKNPERPTDGYVKTGMPALPFQSIDTGMGLERAATVLGGYQNIYEIDAFTPIFAKIDSLSLSLDGRGSVSAANSGEGEDDQIARMRARRVIADHIRTCTFCIADGILPGNTGRGYVLRRLIRRAVLKGQRILGFDKPFFHLVFDGVVEAMGDHYTELVERRDVIIETLRSEEELFRRTIARGIEMLEEELSHFGAGEKTLGGAVAFRLYDTFGFPLEVTQELCEEAGVTVDLEGYEIALKEAQERSRAGSGMDTVYGGVEIVFQFEVQDQNQGPTATRFVGYDSTSSDSIIVGAVPIEPIEGEPAGEIAIALDQTPFYAESGGQISDTGVIRGREFEFEVIDVAKQDGVYVHVCRPNSRTPEHPSELFKQPVRAEVYADRRRAITRNHTATHLLHAALRDVLGKHVTQAGSVVEPDRLRFDFTHGKAMSPEELAEVERRVNRESLAGYPVRMIADVPIEEAKKLGAMALFGEKYGDRVRVVDIRAEDGTQISTELCGGVHVRSTGEIGMFKILHEASAASGVRRIEAVTGETAYEWATRQQAVIKEAAEKLRSNPSDLLSAIEKQVEALREERRKIEKLRNTAAQPSGVEAVQVGAIELVVQRVDDMDAKEATLIADRLAEGQAKRVTLVAAVSEGKVTLIAKAGSEAVANGAHAGNIVKALSQKLGGGGGGRPDFATAGGKDVDALDSALATVAGLLE